MRDCAREAELRRARARAEAAAEVDVVLRVPCAPFRPRAALREAEDREGAIEEGPGSGSDVSIE